MDESLYEQWWPLHLRVARGEALAGEEQARYVSGLVFSRDGQRIASSAQPVNVPNGEIRLWDAATGTELLALRVNKVADLAHLLTFSADGRRLSAAGSGSLWTQFWDATPRH